MQNAVYIIGVIGAVVGFFMFWRLRYRSRAEKRAQERDWRPLATEYGGDLHLSFDGRLARYVLRGQANGAAFRVLTSHHTDLDGVVAGVLPRNNEYLTQVHAPCAGAGPAFILTAVPAGEGDVPFGSAAFAERYTLSHTAGDPAAVIDAATQAHLVEGHRLLLAEGVAFLTGGETVVARFSTATTETSVVRAAIEVVTRVAAASGAGAPRVAAPTERAL